MIKPKTKATLTGRVCTKCWEYKIFRDYNNDKNWHNWKKSYCRDCQKKMKDKLRAKKEYREKELEYKRQYRQTERWRLQLLWAFI